MRSRFAELEAQLESAFDELAAGPTAAPAPLEDETAAAETAPPTATTREAARAA
jgi:hypothetical protein